VPARGDVQNLYYRWSKEFLEVGKKRLAGDTARGRARTSSDELRDLRREAGALKELVASFWLPVPTDPDSTPRQEPAAGLFVTTYASTPNRDYADIVRRFPNAGHHQSA